MAVSKKARFDVFKRDGFACQYCGRHPPQVTLEVDHIHAQSAGGTDEEGNLVTSCLDCNRGKGVGDLQSAPTPLSERAAFVAEREEQLRGYHDIMEARRQRLDDQSWDIATVFNFGKPPETFRRDWLLSIKRFLEKLGFHEVRDAAEIAVARKPHASDTTRFTYFCGVCWNKIKEGQE